MKSESINGNEQRAAGFTETVLQEQMIIGFCLPIAAGGSSPSLRRLLAIAIQTFIA
jgi:hypothetical protein